MLNNSHCFHTYHFELGINLFSFCHRTWQVPYVPNNGFPQSQDAIQNIDAQQND